ncbi:MAG: 4Fe-4S binding protein [Bacteroidales bacterium]|nr:4Fe-4S binding protein [Bacteroidales bacterium]MCF8402840.1 4Fe-4S binding protein [Bacteroidales bacterium]
MKREIIVIDEDLCNGCGLCVPECHEGALQIIDNKARLISDLFCDGLGACIGHCPEGALTIEEREAEPYDEVKVMEIMVTKGQNTITAHLSHLKDHGEFEFLSQAIQYLKKIKYDMDLSAFEEKKESSKEIVEELFGKKANSGIPHSGVMGGCPGSQAREFNIDTEQVNSAGAQANIKVKSELRQWPVQLHLLNPQANYFRNADVVLTADCVAYSMGDFHNKFLKGRSLAIACPKLDSNLESYVSKLTSMINDAQINTMTILRMEVPCCGGLVQMAQMAAQQAGRKIPLKEIVVGVQGDVLSEQWI